MNYTPMHKSNVRRFLTVGKSMTVLTLTPFKLNVMVIHDVNVTVWIL